MRFSARLHPNSAIHRNWAAGRRISGHIDGVLFRWNIQKHAFESDGEITAEQVEVFRNRQDQAVQLESFGVLPESTPQQAHPEDQQQAALSTSQKEADTQQDADSSTVAKQQGRRTRSDKAPPAKRVKLAE